MVKDEDGVEKKDQSALADTEVEKDESGASADDKTDYKALYEKEAEKAENYKKALTQKRQLRKQPEVVIEEDDSDDEDKPLTRRELEKVLVERIMPVVTQNSVESIISGKVKDPEKRKLVKLFYETRIRQTGTSDEDIRRDVDSVLDMVDAPRLRKVSEELIRKKDMTDTTPDLSGSDADRGGDKKTHGYSDEQVKALTERAKRIGADPKKFIDSTWQNERKGGR